MTVMGPPEGRRGEATELGEILAARIKASSLPTEEGGSTQQHPRTMSAYVPKCLDNSNRCFLWSSSPLSSSSSSSEGGGEAKHRGSVGGAGLWESGEKATTAAGAAGGSSLDSHSRIQVLKSNTAVWSPANKAFELDLFEGWKPSKNALLPSKGAAAAAAGPSASAHPSRSASAAESVQLLAPNDADPSSLRVPALQLLKNSGISDSGGSGGSSGSNEWTVSFSQPFSPLQSLGLALLSLEAGVSGAGVSVVDRASATEDDAVRAHAIPQLTLGKLDGGDNDDGSGGGSGGGALKMLTDSARALANALAGTGGKGSGRSSGKGSGRASYRSVAIAPDEGDDGVAGGGKSSGVGRKVEFETGNRAQAGGSGGGEGEGEQGEEQAAPTGESEAAGGLKKRASKSKEREGNDKEGGGLLVGSLDDDLNEAPPMPILVKRRRSLQQAATQVVDKIYRNPYVINLCLLLLLLAFLVELYPSTPGYNSALAVACLWLADRVDRRPRKIRQRKFYYTLSAAMLLSLLLDLNFLTADARAHALMETDEDFEHPKAQELENTMRRFAQAGMIALMSVKFLAWQGLLATSPEGTHALSLFWRRFKLFLPIWGEPRRLTKEVYNRIVALAWLHLLAFGCMLFVVGMTGIVFDWAPQFARSGTAGLPLTLLLLVKSFTLLFVAMALFRNMDLALCLNVFGCLACMQGWHKARELRRKKKHGTTYPKVVLDWDYILLCCKVKLVDLGVGVWLWVGVGYSWNNSLDYSGRWSVQTTLTVITIVHAITDLWCVFLGVVVCLLVTGWLQRDAQGKRPYSLENDNDIEIGTGKEDHLRSPINSGDEYEGEATDTSGDSSYDRRRARGIRSDDSYSSSGSDDSSSDDSSESDTDTDADSSDSEDGDVKKDGRSSVTASATRKLTLSDIDMGLDANNRAQRAPLAGDGGDGAGGMSATSEWIMHRAFSLRGSEHDTESLSSGRGSVFSGSGAESLRSGQSGQQGHHRRTLPLTLSRELALSPEEFRSKWDVMEHRGGFRCRVEAVPELAVVASHLQRYKFQVVASGIVGQQAKIYSSAQSSSSSLRPACVCLMELVFDTDMFQLEAKFKCEDKALLPSFVRHLRLKEVVPGFQPVA